MTSRLREGGREGGGEGGSEERKERGREGGREGGRELHVPLTLLSRYFPRETKVRSIAAVSKKKR